MAKEQEPVQPVAPRAGETPELDELSKLIEQEHQFAKEVEEGEKKLTPESQTKFSNYLPRLIQKALNKMDASQIYQSFRLVGKDYVVYDQRDKKETGNAIEQESKTPLQELLMVRGKLVASKEKSYENYLSDPSARLKVPGQATAQGPLLKMLSAFEKMLLKRFEGGENLETLCPEGRFSFLKKTAEQWRGFFSHFVRRTVKRRVALEQLQGWVYRDVVPKKGVATLISDLSLADGRLEKFVRFRLAQDPNLMQFLSQLESGARLSGTELKKFLGGDLEYLAIKEALHRASFSPAQTKGKFLGAAQTEARVAKELGVSLKIPSFDLQKEEENPKESFIPWWQWGLLQKREGKTRWFVVSAYLVIAAAVVVGILFLLMKF